MKWLIFSTIGKNPGDEFIRVGAEYLIKKVDPNAVIEVLNKETDDIYKNSSFDKCIWAGMPVFWSLNSNNNWSIKWWKHMTGQWPSTNKNNFCVLGAGSFQDWSDIRRGADVAGLVKSAKDLDKSSFTVVARDPIVNQLCQSNFKTLICPAVFSCQERPKTGSLKACNLMPSGSHYRDFNQMQAAAWDGIKNKIADVLIQNNFIFFAHSSAEYAFAKSLGWKDSAIINYSGKTEAMLSEYRNIDKYFGNRVHGCIVSRGNGADVISCGYDSRQEAVKLSGAKCFLPSDLNIFKLKEWAEKDIVTDSLDLESLESEYLNILTKFKEQA